MLSDYELMKIQIETLFIHDQNRRLQYINEPGSYKPLAPRFFLGQTRAGNFCRFRYDLPDKLIKQLDELFASEPIATDLRNRPIYFERFKDVLQAHAIIHNVWIGPAYRFPDEIKPPTHVVRITRENAELLEKGFAETIPELEMIQPCIAVIEDERAVSVCQSVRLSSHAYEAGVDTLEAYRGRGHAADAVAGWAVAVRELGRIPLYSTSWDNEASQGVARKLGLVMYGVDLSFM